ncbi:hypothetical protein V4Y02_23595, partial [Escherichia coli]
ISFNEIEESIKIFLKNKCRIRWIMDFKELIPVFLKLFPEIERVEILPNLFFEASITLTPKLVQDTSRKENLRPTWT